MLYNGLYSVDHYNVKRASKPSINKPKHHSSLPQTAPEPLPPPAEHHTPLVGVGPAAVAASAAKRSGQGGSQSCLDDENVSEMLGEGSVLCKCLGTLGLDVFFPKLYVSQLESCLSQKQLEVFWRL